MRDFFKWLFYDVKKDKYQNYHKRSCKLFNEKFITVILPVRGDLAT